AYPTALEMLLDSAEASIRRARRDSDPADA
ncbi:TetR/AcrR family transcriptional regulator, partial [Streptomyces sp. SID7982]|nr:TetR/AcrR family transcriptional regulator [Streptomyces sp. SID7982]